MPNAFFFSLISHPRDRLGWVLWLAGVHERLRPSQGWIRKTFNNPFEAPTGITPGERGGRKGRQAARNGKRAKGIRERELVAPHRGGKKVKPRFQLNISQDASYRNGNDILRHVCQPMGLNVDVAILPVLMVTTKDISICPRSINISILRCTCTWYFVNPN